MIDRLQSFAKSPLEIQPLKIHPDFDDFVAAEEAWQGRKKGKFGKHDVCYIAREDYIKNKRTVGRHKDLADLESLGEKPWAWIIICRVLFIDSIGRSRRLVGA